MAEIYTVSRAHSGLKISLHPLAQSAYEWVVTSPKLIDWQALPESVTNLLLRDPLRGVMIYDLPTEAKRTRAKATEFQLYAPLWSSLYWPSDQPPEGTLLIHNSGGLHPSDQDIEEAAWLSALGLLMFSIDSRAIAELRDSLQALLPTHLSRQFFNKRRISDADLCHWTGISRGTLVQQRQRAKPTASVPALDPLQALAAPWTPSS